MKVICRRKEFDKAIRATMGVCPSRTPKDILKKLLFVFGPDSGEICGTDSEVDMRSAFEGVGAEQSGSALLPVDKVVSVLSETKSENIEFDVTDRSIQMKCDGSTFMLAAQDPAEFPPIARFDESAYSIVPSSMMKLAIGSTVFAVDETSTSWNLSGVYIRCHDSHIQLCATDGRRGSLIEPDCQNVGEVPLDGRLVPTKALKLFDRCLDGGSEAQIALSANTASFRVGGTTVISKLITGRFPSLRKALPTQFNHEIVLNPGSLLSAARQSMIVRGVETAGVDFVFHEGNLRLDSEATNVGSSTVEIPIAYTGDELTVRFDPKYLIDVLKVLDVDTILTCKIVDEGTAIVFESGKLTYFIMPQRVETVVEPAALAKK